MINLTINLDVEDHTPCWVELKPFFRKFTMEALGRSGLNLGDMHGLIILAGDARKQKKDYPVWENLPDLLFSATKELADLSKPLLDNKGAPRVNTIYVEALIVDDECRGRGIGQQMMAKLYDLKDVAPIVMLRASPLLSELFEIPEEEHAEVKQKLFHFYEKLGFTKIGTDTFCIATKNLEQVINPELKQSRDSTVQPAM